MADSKDDLFQQITLNTHNDKENPQNIDQDNIIQNQTTVAQKQVSAAPNQTGAAQKQTSTAQNQTAANNIKQNETTAAQHDGLSCHEKLGFIFNKFWLYRITIKLGFNKPRITTMAEAIFYLFCIFDFLLCIHLTMNSVYYHKLNKLYITSTFALHSGLLTGIFYAFVIFLSLRYPFYWKWGLFMMGFDRQMLYHGYCAWLAIICCVLHIIDNYRIIFEWKAITGWICYGFSILMLIFATSYFRRSSYNKIFIHSHWIFLIGFVVFGWLHNAILVIYGTFIVIIDVVLRLLDNKIRSVTIDNISMLDNDRVIRIDFKKKYFSYRAGQYVFVRIKEIGLLEFHPFSISSYPSSGDIITLFIKTFKTSYGGNWCDRLSNYIITANQDQPDWYKNIYMQIEGPFGELTLPKPIHEYNHIIFIGGGIGITPIDSLFNQLVHDLTEGNVKNANVSEIDYIFTTRSRALITEFASRNNAWKIVDHDEELRIQDNNIDYNDPLSNHMQSVELKHESYLNSNVPTIRKMLHGRVQLSSRNLFAIDEKVKKPIKRAESLVLHGKDFHFGQNKKGGVITLKKSEPFDIGDDDDDEHDLSFDSRHDVEIENMAVDSLCITNSVHITRVKDENLRKYYKKAFPFINFERPNIRGIIYNAAAKTKSKNMCIVTSGPKSMIRECIKYGNEVGITVHNEIFDW